MILLLPSPVETAIKELESHGFEAYIVGGAIRDTLLGKTPHDFDIATNATSKEIQKIFANRPQINNNGAKHGTITVRIESTNIEITSFRGSSIEEDLSHRDFSINAIAYSHGKLIDPRCGESDIKRRLITMGDDPEKIIKEDPLRILRALRFHASLGFAIDETTSTACKEYANLLTQVAKERILAECRMIFIAEDIEYILQEYRVIFGVLFPCLVPCFDHDQHNPWHANDLYTHIVKVVAHVPSTFILRTAALFHDIGKIPTESIEDKGNGTYVKHFYGHPIVSKDMAKPLLEEYRFPNDEKEEILFLIAHHDNEIALTKKSVKKALAKITSFSNEPLKVLEELLDLQISDHLDHTTITPIHKEETLRIAQSILSEKDAFQIKDLDINGNDLKALGYEGVAIGIALKSLLEAVIEEKVINEKQSLIRYLDELKIK